MTPRGGESIHMVFTMTGRLQECPVTLAILTPCFRRVEALLPFVSRASSGLWSAFSGMLILPLTGSWFLPTSFQGLRTIGVVVMCSD